MQIRSAWLLVAIFAACCGMSACGSVARSSGTLSTTERVVVTGYGSITPSGGRFQPVSVSLTATQVHRLTGAVGIVLGNHNANMGCHAVNVLYAIAFYKRGNSHHPKEALGIGCGGDNLLYPEPGGSGAHYAVGFDSGCRLLKLVVSVLPSGAAGATRSSLSGCLQLGERS